MTKKEIKNFLKDHPLSRISAAGILLSIYENPDSVKNLDATAAKNQGNLDQEHAKLIEEAETEKEFFRLMRKPLSWENQEVLVEKMLPREEQLAPFILEKSLRNMQDNFVETATSFFMRAKQDYSKWILEHYDEIQNAYMKSMYCMILGLRGDETIAPFLESEYANFAALCPGQGFEQGPLIGLHEIAYDD